MGVYIKGMKPPNDCYECPCKKWTDDGCAGCWADDKIHNASRPDDCPLIEIHEPHGDLIDRNMLDPDSEYEDGDFWAVSVTQIKLMPAVIEAERSEDE